MDRKVTSVVHKRHFYRPQTKFMFLQVSVCPQGGGRCAWWGGHVWLPGGMSGCRGACMVAGGMWLLGGHAWLLGGVHGCWGMGGVFWLQGGQPWLQGGMHGCQGACMVARGACMVAGGMRGCRGACVVVRGCAWWWGGMRGIRWDTVNERAVCILLECILVLT